MHEEISKFIISQFFIRNPEPGNQKDDIFKGQKEKNIPPVCKYTFVKVVFNMREKAYFQINLS